METKINSQERYTVKTLSQLFRIKQSQIASFIKQGLRIERTKSGLVILGEDLIRFIEEKRKTCIRQDLH